MGKTAGYGVSVGVGPQAQLLERRGTTDRKVPNPLIPDAKQEPYPTLATKP